jgi:Fe-S cluster assembly protein SufD
MSQWLDQVIAHAEKTGAPVAWQETKHTASLNALKQHNWPTRKSESWRFTSLLPVEARDFVMNKTADLNSVSDSVSAIAGLDAIDIEFVNGQLLTDLNQLSLPDGVSICGFSNATDDSQKAFNTIKPEKHLFGLVNDTVIDSGIIVSIANNVEFATPIRFVHHVTENSENHSRILVNVGENAKVTIIEHGEGSASSVNTSFAEYDVKASAYLQHYRFALFSGQAIHAGGSHFRLAEHAKVESTVVGFGSALSRLDMDVIYTGEQANAFINAMYLLAEGENFDLQTTIEHAVPNCTTTENVRGIVGDRAKANFNGRIHIHRDAQKTLAELNNRNLLLSRRGQINTKPELEIYADDVKCAHGATVAEIEEKALYYLLSRGIKRSQALIMLNFGFIQELINDIELSAINLWLTDVLRERFSLMEVK